MRRLAIFLLLTGGFTIAHASAAYATGQREAHADIRADVPVVSVGSEADVDGPQRDVRSRSARNTPPADCVWKRVTEDELVATDEERRQMREYVLGEPQPVEQRPPGHWLKKDCKSAEGVDPIVALAVEEERYVPDGPARLAVTPVAVAQQAKQELPLPLPEVHMDPAPDKIHTVNVPTFLWLGQAWTPLSATASIDGVSATVQATPVSVTWDMGDGHNLICNSPGTASDPNIDLRKQSTDCQYTYTQSSAGQPDEAWTVRATVNYAVSWISAGVAGGGDLGYVSRSSTFPVKVAEIQAVNVIPNSELQQ